MKPLLVHFQPRLSPTGARTDVRLASGGSAAASGLGGFRWQTAVVRRPRLSIDLLSPALDGRIQPGRADLVINLARIRDVDAFALYWLGAPVTMYDATGLDLATAPIEFVGLVRSATLNVENDQLALNLEVSTQALEKPALYNEFAGTGGAEGSAEFFGKVKPAGFGSVKNIEPVWFDTTRNIGMIDGYGNCTAITALFEGGNDFGARVANYASYADLAAAIDSKAIAPGRWGTCVAAGLVGLGAPPVKPITVDATFGTNRPGALIRRLIEIHAIVPAADVDIPAFTSLDAAVNRPVHHWMGAQRSVKDLVEAIAGSVNATPIVTFQGKFSITRAFGGTNALTINRQAPTKATRVTAWRALDPETPIWRMKMRAARPGAVLSTDQILYADDLIDRGGYVSTETYRQGNMVWTDDGAQYLYTNAVPSAGTAPPTPPTTSNTHWTQTKAPDAPTDAFYEDGTSIDALRPRQVGADVTANNTAGAITGQAPTATSSDFDAITGIRKPADYAGTTIPLEIRGTATMLLSGNSARKTDGDGAYNGAVVGPGYKGNAFVEARFSGLIAGSKWAVIALDNTNTGIDSGSPPVNTVAPAITGSLTSGNVLTVSNGTWSESPTGYAYQWKRGTTNVGTNANTYTTVTADEGSNITCVVTATNPAGSGTATSNSVGPIAAPLAAPTLTAAPTITGSTVRGNVLTVSNGTWTGEPTAYGYQWLRNGSVNIGTNANTYTTVLADEGATITCVVSATNAAGTTTAPETAAVGPITAPAHAYATYAVAVDFAPEKYFVAGTEYTTVSALPGYAFTRSGQVGAYAKNGGVQWFAAGVPVINADGYRPYDAATNLAYHTQNFESWPIHRVVVAADQAVAPDGTTTAERVTETADTGYKLLQSGGFAVAADTYSFSVFAKAGTHNLIQLLTSDGSSLAYANFDLTAGTVTQQGGGGTGYIIPLANGWYRCVMVGAQSASGSTNFFFGSIPTATTTRAANTAGDVNRNFLVWQADIYRGDIRDGGPIIHNTTAQQAIAASTMKHNVGALADADQLFWLDVDYSYVSGAKVRRLGYLTNAAANGYLGFVLLTGGPGFVAHVAVGGGTVFTVEVPTTLGNQSLFLLRSAGTWRTGFVKDGVVTYGGAATAGGFPTGADIAKLGMFVDDLGHGDVPVRGFFRKSGTFTTDAAILAAIAESA